MILAHALNFFFVSLYLSLSHSFYIQCVCLWMYACDMKPLESLFHSFKLTWNQYLIIKMMHIAWMKFDLLEMNNNGDFCVLSQIWFGKLHRNGKKKVYISLQIGRNREQMMNINNEAKSCGFFACFMLYQSHTQALYEWIILWWIINDKWSQ